MSPTTATHSHQQLRGKAQWLLDDAAHQVPGNRYSPEQAAELAEALEELAFLVRETILNPVATEA